MTKRMILFAAFLLISLLGASCSGRSARITPTPVPTPVAIQKPTYQVQSGAVTKTIQLQGRVSPVQYQELFFRADGYIRSVNFSRGDTVKAGDVLAELELGDLEIQLSQSQLSLQQAEAKLAQAQKEHADQLIEAQMALEKANLAAQQAGALGMNPSVEIAEANVKQAEDKLKTAQREYQKALNTAKVGKQEKEEFRKKVDQARWELDAAKRRLESAKNQHEFEQNLEAVQTAMEAALQEYRQILNDSEASLEDKEAMRQKLETAKQAYVDAWMEYAQIVGGPTYLSPTARTLSKDLALARMKVEELKAGIDPLMFLDVEQRRLDLETVQKKVDRARLIAPFDGQILSQNLTPGNQAIAFRPVLTLADPSALDITVRPSADDLTLLGVGQAVTVQLLSRVGQTFTGSIHLLPYLSDAGEAESSDSDQAAHITLDDPSISLNMSEAATVVIEVDRRENVLWLPPAALRTFQGRDFVFVEENGVQRRVDVRLGLRSAERVEILEGLAEGQTVVGP